MARSRWLLGLFALLLLVAGSTDAHAKYRVAFLPNTTAQALTRAWSMSTAYTPNWKLTEFHAADPMMEAETQATMMDELIGQGYDSIIPQPIDAAVLVDSVRKAETKDIQAITLNTSITHTHAAHVTMDDFGAGLLARGIIGKAINGKKTRRSATEIITTPPFATTGETVG